MGNICRSPTAEAVFCKAVAAAGIADSVDFDSAGVDSYHIGEPPDSRAQQVGRSRGYDLSSIRARAVSKSDFERFDLILAMDQAVLRRLEQRCPNEYKNRLMPYMMYSRGSDVKEIPDPYYGGQNGFEHVLDLIEDVTSGLLEFVKKQLSSKA